jgi:hypothetical protein
MKLSVHYDPSGKVRSFVAVGGTHDNGMMLVPKPGALVAEVEGVSLEAGVAGLKKLREIAKSCVAFFRSNHLHPIPGTFFALG